MQVVWVQHWSYLPVIVEDIDMSDGRQSGTRLPSTQLPADNIYHATNKDGPLVTCRFPEPCDHWHTEFHLTDMAAKAHTSITPQTFPAQGFGPQTLQRAGLLPTMPGQQAAPYGQGPGQTGGVFNMSELGENLPEYHPPAEGPERTTSGSGATLHQQSPSPFAGQTPMTNPGYGVYSQYPTHYQQAAANAQAYSLSQLNQPSQTTGPSPIQPPYSGQTYYQANQQQQQYLLYPGQFGQAGQPHQALHTQYAQPFARGSNPGFGIGPPQHVPDVPGVPTRLPQYGGFSSSGLLNYGYGPAASFSRLGMAPGKPAPSALLGTLADWALFQHRQQRRRCC